MDDIEHEIERIREEIEENGGASGDD